MVRTRYLAVLLGGAIAGFGGTYFTLDSGRQLRGEHDRGPGFIALAALIFGRWNPVGAFGAALVFGFAEEFQGAAGVAGLADPVGVPPDGAVPVTLVVVAGLIGPGPPAGGRRPAVRTVTGGRLGRPRGRLRRSGRTRPYSNYFVGAAGLVDDGEVVTGCNVENASYGLTLCAECGLVSALHAPAAGGWSRWR